MTVQYLPAVHVIYARNYKVSKLQKSKNLVQLSNKKLEGKS